MQLGAKECSLLQDFSVFLTLHSSSPLSPADKQPWGICIGSSLHGCFLGGRKVRWLRAARTEGEVHAEDTVTPPWVKQLDLRESHSSQACRLTKSCSQLLQGHVILGPQKADGPICDCLCLPAIIRAQQLSQNSLFKQQDFLYSAQTAATSSLVRDF